jgi:Flp pilus assembly protein TadG
VRRRGQSLVEFALVLPLLMLVFMSIVQFGMLFSAQIALINGVREAARFGSVSPTIASNASANADMVRAHLTSVLSGSMVGFTSSSLTGNEVCYVGYADPGASTWSVRMTVTATYAHPLFIPIVGILLDGFDGSNDDPDALSLSASEQFRVENLPLQSNPIATPLCRP